MMMARDTTPNRPQLSSAAVDSLRTALLDYLERGGEDPTAVLQTTLRQTAVEAREKEMHAEQLLVQLKDLWFALPEIGQAGEGDRQLRLLQRVVSICIREYYST